MQAGVQVVQGNPGYYGSRGSHIIAFGCFCKYSGLTFACMLGYELRAGVMQLDEDLMPDALHPNAAGMDLFAKCFAEEVHRHMGPPSSL